MSAFAQACVISAALCTGPVLALANAKPVPGEVTLVLASPGAEISELVAESGGRLVGPVTGFIGALAISTDPTFHSELKSNGAWFVFNGKQLAQLCGVSV
jgi:hypothetical protein